MGPPDPTDAAGPEPPASGLTQPAGQQSATNSPASEHATPPSARPAGGSNSPAHRDSKAAIVVHPASPETQPRRSLPAAFSTPGSAEPDAVQLYGAMRQSSIVDDEPCTPVGTRATRRASQLQWDTGASLSPEAGGIDQHRVLSTAPSSASIMTDLHRPASIASLKNPHQDQSDRSLLAAVSTMHSALERPGSGWATPLTGNHVRRMLQAVELLLTSRQRTAAGREAVRDEMTREVTTYLSRMRKRKTTSASVNNNRFRGVVCGGATGDSIPSTVDFYSADSEESPFVPPPLDRESADPLLGSLGTAGSWNKSDHPGRGMSARHPVHRFSVAQSLAEAAVGILHTTGSSDGHSEGHSPSAQRPSPPSRRQTATEAGTAAAAAAVARAGDAVQLVTAELEELKPLRGLDAAPLWPEESLCDLQADTASMITRHAHRAAEGVRMPPVDLWGVGVLHAWTYELHYRVVWAAYVEDSWEQMQWWQVPQLEALLDSGQAPQWGDTACYSPRDCGLPPHWGATLYDRQLCASEDSEGPETPLQQLAPRCLVRYVNPHGGTPLSPLRDPALWLPPLPLLLDRSSAFSTDKLIPSGVIEFVLSQPVTEVMSSARLARWCSHGDADAELSPEDEWQVRPLADQGGPVARLVRLCIVQRNQRRYQKELDDQFRALLSSGAAGQVEVAGIDLGDAQQCWQLVPLLFRTKLSAARGLDTDKPTPSSIAHSLGVQLLEWRGESYLLCLDATMGEVPVVAKVTSGEVTSYHRMACLTRAQFFAELSSAMRCRQFRARWPRVSVSGTANGSDGEFEATGYGREVKEHDLVYSRVGDASDGAHGLDKCTLFLGECGFALRPAPGGGVPVLIPNQLCRFTYGERLLRPLLRLIYMLERALRQLPAPETEQKNYRGLTNTTLPRDVYFTGNVVLWSAPSASSADQGIATGFADVEDNEGRSAVFTLRGRSCRSIGRLSRFGREREFLYLPNTYFEVVAQLTDDQREILGREGLQLLEMREIDSYEALDFFVRRLLTSTLGEQLQLPRVQRTRIGGGGEYDGVVPQTPAAGQWNARRAVASLSLGYAASRSPSSGPLAGSDALTLTSTAPPPAARRRQGLVAADPETAVAELEGPGLLHMHSAVLDPVPPRVGRPPDSYRWGPEPSAVHQILALSAALHEKDASKALAVVLCDGPLLHFKRGAVIIKQLGELEARCSTVVNEALLSAAASGDVVTMLRLIGEHSAAVNFRDTRLGVEFSTPQDVVRHAEGLSQPRRSIVADAPGSDAETERLRQLVLAGGAAEAEQPALNEIHRVLMPLAARFPMLNAGLVQLGAADRKQLAGLLRSPGRRAQLFQVMHRAGMFATDLPGTPGGTAFHAAARHGRALALSVLAEVHCATQGSGSELRADCMLDAYGWTPLHVAARSGHVAVVRELLRVGSVEPGLFPGVRALHPVAQVVYPLARQLERMPVCATEGQDTAANPFAPPSVRVPDLTPAVSLAAMHLGQSMSGDAAPVEYSSAEDQSAKRGSVQSGAPGSGTSLGEDCPRVLLAPLLRFTTLTCSGATAAHLAWEAQQGGRLGGAAVLHELKKHVGQLPVDIVQVPLWVQVSGLACFLTIPLVGVGLALPWCTIHWNPPDTTLPFSANFQIWDLIYAGDYSPHNLKPGQWVMNNITGGDIDTARRQTEQTAQAVLVLSVAFLLLLVLDFGIALSAGYRLEARLRLTVANTIKRLARLLPHLCGLVGCAAGCTSIGLMIYIANWAPVGWKVRPGYYCASVAFLVSVLHAILIVYMRKPSHDDTLASFWL